MMTMMQVLVVVVVVQEYEGLTNKIHELQMREDQLHEVLFDYQHSATSSTSAAAAGAAADHVLMMSDSASSAVSSMSPGGGGTDTSLQSSILHDDDAASAPTSKIRSIVRAHLPKKMTTVVRPVHFVMLSLLLPGAVFVRERRGGG